METATMLRTEYQVHRGEHGWTATIERNLGGRARTSELVHEDGWRVVLPSGERSQPLPDSEATATLSLLAAEADERGVTVRRTAYRDEVA